MERLGFLGDRVIAGYLKEGSPSFSAVETSVRRNYGTVDREDMLTELLLSYFEKKADGTISEAGKTLTFVHNALDKVGYDPISQLAGYLLSDDPSYITNRENARNIIRRIDRHDLIMELVTSYYEK